MLLKSLLHCALDFALPRACLLCDTLSGGGAGLVCGPCWRQLPVLESPRCDRCGHPVSGQPCRWCAFVPPGVAAARSACWVPEGIGGELVHKLKYDGWTGLANELAARIPQLPATRAGPHPMILVPVPLGRARLRERGFNQCAVLADALARQWAVPVAHAALVRRRETVSQVRLTPGERSANVHGAFAAGAAASAIRGRHAVIVDDVVTTAATLTACAAAARAAGALTISFVTFGRARAAFDRRMHPRSSTRWPYASASTASAALVARSSAPPRSAALPTSISSRSMT